MVSVEDRFWAKVQKTEGCWIWTGAVGKSGYGNFGVSAKQTVYAHRFAFELLVGVIPAGLFACHSCDNKRCCNPAHIWPGTNSENMKDAIVKGLRTFPRKTHCHKGHEKTPDNTISSGMCKTCNREYQRNYWHQHTKPKMQAACRSSF